MKVERLTTLDVRKVGRRNWELTAPFVVKVTRDDGTSFLIRVNSGFVTDFASVPRIPLVFFLFGGIGEYAACIHDFLYRTGMLPRDESDAIFRAALIDMDETSAARAFMMHKGVRLGGVTSYIGYTT